MTIIHGGKTNYGETIGIIMLDTVFPRIPGDVGNAGTFSFPVKYKIVKGASPQRVVQEADPQLLQPFIEAARELEQEGVRAITTSCGFLAIFQKQLAEAVNIPVFTSSLLQVHLAQNIINSGKKVGILTARAQSLTSRHFAGVGLAEDAAVVVGMDEAPEFSATFIGGKSTLDVEKCREEMIEAAQKLVERYPEAGAIVLECTNMPPFSQAIQDTVQLPVFDVVTMINYIHSAVVQRKYPFVSL